MSEVNFGDAFERWYRVADAEDKRLAEEKGRSGVLSWEALDHLCGLVVESGIKAMD